MKTHTLEVRLVFPVAAHDADIAFLLERLPKVLEDDLSAICSLCLPPEQRSKSVLDVEVTLLNPQIERKSA